jgi:hypothetical protein
MRLNLGLALKILALFFWWYIVVFLLSVAPLLEVQLPSAFIPEFRGAEYAWDFELMFTLIFAVWGYYLWVASRAPEQHSFFINFTIVATFAHILGMLLVGFVKEGDLWHMLKDAVALSVPTVLVLYLKLRH